MTSKTSKPEYLSDMMNRYAQEKYHLESDIRDLRYRIRELKDETERLESSLLIDLVTRAAGEDLSEKAYLLRFLKVDWKAYNAWKAGR